MEIFNINREKIETGTLIKINNLKFEDFKNNCLLNNQNKIITKASEYSVSYVFDWEIKKLAKMCYFVEIGEVIFFCGIQDFIIEEVYNNHQILGYYLKATFDFYSNECGFYKVSNIPILYSSRSNSNAYRRYVVSAKFGIQNDVGVENVKWGEVYNSKGIINTYAWWYEVKEKNSIFSYNINIIKNNTIFKQIYSLNDVLKVNDVPNIIGYLQNEEHWCFYDFYRNSTELMPNNGYIKNQLLICDSINTSNIASYKRKIERNSLYLLPFDTLASETRNAYKMLICKKMYYYEKIQNYKGNIFEFEFENNYKKIGNIAITFASKFETFKKTTFNKYYVSFSYEQCEQIEMMYFILRKLKYEFDKNLLKYLNEISLLRRAENLDEIWFDFFDFRVLCKDGNYSKEEYKVFAECLKKTYQTYIKDKRNKIYNDAIASGKSFNKWSSEQKLYSMVVKYFNDAIYQYRADWLGLQSLDVFIPSLKLGIEYQGKQHYESVPIFDGEHRFELQKRRDKEKREKCISKNVLLIEWKYDEKINQEVLKEKLNQFAIELPKLNVNYTWNEEKIKNTKYKNEIKAEKCKKIEKRESQNIVKKYVVQYDIDGNYIAKYESESEAGEKTNTNKGAISHVIRNIQKTAGGYVWRIFEKDKIPQKIEKTVTQNIEPVKVEQVDKNGNVIKVFNSISEAVKITGVDSKSIRNVIKNKQKTAGGYIWRVSKEKIFHQ